MTEQEAQRVRQIISQTSVRCLGRFMFDIPKAFVLSSESAMEVDEVKVTVRAESEHLFNLVFEQRRKMLEGTMLPGKDPNRPYLRSTLPLPSGQVGAIFDRAEQSASSGRLGRTLELLAWRDGYRIEASINATDTTFPEDADDPLTKQLRTDVPEKLQALLQVFQRVRGRAESEIPTEQGLCFANGLLLGAPTRTESVQMAYVLDGTPDVYFNFFSQTEVREKNTMLDRSGEMESSMARAGAKTLRKGARTMQGLKYEEWLMGGPTVDRVPGTVFTLQANETEAEPSKPVIEFKFYNGFRVPAPQRTLEQKAQMTELTKASLSPAEAVGIWDAVTATIRPWRASR